MARSLNIRGNPDQVFKDINEFQQGRPLGTRMHLSDGRVYRWGRNQTETVAVGRIMQSGKQDEMLTNIAPDASYLKNTEKITLTIVAARENIELGRYNDGLLYVHNGAGEGHVYTIRASHRVQAGVSTIDIYLDGNLHTDVTTGSRITLIRSRFNRIEISSTYGQEQIVGVSPLALTANSYTWIQTAGACAILQDGELFQGRDVTKSELYKGACKTLTNVIPSIDANVTERHRYARERGRELITYDNPDAGGSRSRLAIVTGVGILPKRTIGFALDPRADTEFGLINLTLDN